MTKLAIVIGMGRSGTSLLCQVLEKMGVYFGEPSELIGEWAINERGQYEHIEIQRIHRELLANCFGAETWLWSGKLQEGWQRHDYVEPYCNRLRDAVCELTWQRSLCGVKDARITRLLPLWRMITSELELEPVWLLTWRHPRAVYQSLVEAGKTMGSEPRNSEDDVLDIWAQYMCDGMALGQELGAVVSYERWFTHAREQADTVAGAVGLPALTDEQLREVIEPKLCHHVR